MMKRILSTKSYKTTAYFQTDRLYLPFEGVTNFKLSHVKVKELGKDEYGDTDPKYEYYYQRVYLIGGDGIRKRNDYYIPSKGVRKFQVHAEVEFDYAYKKNLVSNYRGSTRAIHEEFKRVNKSILKYKGHFHSTNGQLIMDIQDILVEASWSNQDGVSLVDEILAKSPIFTIKIDHFTEKMTKMEIEGRYCIDGNFKCVELLNNFDYDKKIKEVFTEEDCKKIYAPARVVTEEEINNYFINSEKRKYSRLKLQIKKCEEKLKKLKAGLKE